MIKISKSRILFSALVVLLLLSSALVPLPPASPAAASSPGSVLREEWRYPLQEIDTLMLFGASPGIADLGADVNNKGGEPDSDLEIVSGSDEFQVFYPDLGTTARGAWRVYDSKGNVEWARPTDSDEARSSVAIADLNGDGNLEIAGGTTSGWNVEVMDRLGNWDWTFPYPPVTDGPFLWHSSPAVADFDVRSVVDLLDSQQNAVGKIWEFTLKPLDSTTCPEPQQNKDCLIADAQMMLDLMGHERQVIRLTGPVSIQRGEPVTSGDGLQVIPTEIVSMNLTGTSSLGPVTVTLNPSKQSLGKATSQVSGTCFPADSFFDIFVEIQIGNDTYESKDPLRIRTVVDALPPLGAIYQNSYSLSGLEVIEGSRLPYPMHQSPMTAGKVEQTEPQGGSIWAFDGDNSDGVDDGVTVADLSWYPGPPGTEGVDWDVLWIFNTEGSVISTPAIADVDGDGALEVVFGDGYSEWNSIGGTVYCLDAASGTLEWKYKTGGDSVTGSAGLADFDGDGDLEVVIGSYDFNIYFINGDENNNGTIDAEEVATYATGDKIHSSPAIGDVDGDGYLEAVIGSDDGNVYCLGYDPATNTVTEKWAASTGGAVYASPALANRANVAAYAREWPFFRANVARTGVYAGGVGNALAVYITSTDGKLYLIDGTDGSIIDTFETKGPIYTSPSVADADGDSKLEIFFYDSASQASVAGIAGALRGSRAASLSQVSTLDTFWAIEDTAGEPVTEPQWFWKAGEFVDYAPIGMPDFDQNRADWTGYSAPAALANSLWWFDSKFETNPVAPPEVNDGYRLVESYGGWDDHNPLNVVPLVAELGTLMDTDGQTSNDSHGGTRPEDLAQAVTSYLQEKQLAQAYSVNLVSKPAFDWVVGEVERSEDVILLLSLWQLQPVPDSQQKKWVRLGGHYVTVAGVSAEAGKIAFSDPMRDNAEAGYTGRVIAPHPSHEFDETVHDDAGFASHDVYTVVPTDSPGGVWGPREYVLFNFQQLMNTFGYNVPSSLEEFQGEFTGEGIVVTEVEYALAVSPKPPEEQWIFKKGGWVDYAPAGVPDFDQKPFDTGSSSVVSADAPVAVANSLWWFDSKFEPNPVAPPAINDNYPLVESYGQWDDHDPSNVFPLVLDLATRMNTNAGSPGTMVEDVVAGIDSYMTGRGVRGQYTITKVKSPEFGWVAEEVARSEDVVLLLGFWQNQGTAEQPQWVRLGGHYVTVTGVNPTVGGVAFSDPFKDNAEAGAPGFVPTPHPVHVADPTVHNDAQFVSYDIYPIAPTQSPGGVWGPEGYASTQDDVAHFLGANSAEDLVQFNGAPGAGAIVTEVEYAIAVSPSEGPPVDKMFWKEGGWADYAPYGVPDFDQKQWTGLIDAPLAVANSLWWFDSKFERNPLPPSSYVNDTYPLVQSYSPAEWDDHNPNNVLPLVQDLAGRMKLTPTGPGAMVEDVADAIDGYLVDKGLRDRYTITTLKSPGFDWVLQEVSRCEDVVLLLGFWENQGTAEQPNWVRLGGHYVTTAGIGTLKPGYTPPGGVGTPVGVIAISDPFRDNAEAVNQGSVPNPHPAHPADPTVHLDAQFVSHDGYLAVSTSSPGGSWGPFGYSATVDQIQPFLGANSAQDLLEFQGNYAGGEIVTEVEYAVAVSPAGCCDIDSGLTWLAPKQNSDGSWGTANAVAKTGLAVLKYSMYASELTPPLSPFDAAYAYKANVEAGLRYLFTNAHIAHIGLQDHDGDLDNPDLDGDGIGVYFNSPGGESESPTIYSTSIVAMAVAASNAPSRIISLPGSPINGWTFEQLERDIVDFLAWAQTDPGGGRGGWNYEAMDNRGDRSDQSNSGYAALALQSAEAPPPVGFGLAIPAFVREELEYWVTTVQNTTPGDPNEGGSGYSDRGGANILRTGNLLQQFAFLGDTATTPRVQAAIGYLVRTWSNPSPDPGWRGSPASYQAMYTTMKGLESLHVDLIDSINWYGDFMTTMCAEQNPDGSFPPSLWDDGEQILSTLWALLTCEKVVARPIEKPDLVVVDKREAWVNEAAGTYQVYYKVKNRGNVASAGVGVWLYVDEALTSPGQDIGALAPGEVTPEMTWTQVITLTDEFDHVKVCVDVNNAIDEMNEANNCAVNIFPPVEKPDLVITLKHEEWVTQSPGLPPAYNVFFTLRNIGTGTAPLGSKVKITVDGTDVGTVEVPVDLAPLGTWVGSFGPISLEGTEDAITVCADTKSTVAELDENNNCNTNTLLAPPPELQWFWKEGAWADYAPSGVPDFDMKQEQWSGYSAPVAVANSLWWFDSKFEPNPVPIPSINDNYPLVQSYNTTQWDDHCLNNVVPLVQDLATRMHTNTPHNGTMVEDVVATIESYMTEKGVRAQYTITKVKAPEFGWVTEEVSKSEDVILLLGFWENLGTAEQPNWVRLGGHYVTVAGVGTIPQNHMIQSVGEPLPLGAIAFSDPWRDSAELGGQGIVPNPHPAHSADPTVHNNAAFVSHDVYQAVSTSSPGGVWGPAGYALTAEDVQPFINANWAQELGGASYSGGEIVTEVDYAIAVSPVLGPPPGAIAGTVRLQGRTNHSGAVVTADSVGATTDADGNFTLNLAEGTYNVTASMAGYLSAHWCDVGVTTGGSTTLEPVTLLGGDANEDGQIDISDIVLIAGAFGTSPLADAHADINGDGAANILDLSLAGLNFGETERGCQPFPPPSPDIAYIHSSDTASAASYKSLGESSGHLTALIPLSSVATADFSPYKLIIIGSDTGSSSGGAATWGDSASVAAVNGSGKPIVGLGEGGYEFFGELGLGTGWPHGWECEKNSIYVVDSSHAVFHTPNSIAIPGDKVIQLYTATSTWDVGIHLPSIPANIVALGREADDAVHYPLTLENQRYLLWGFTASPNSMTQTGKDLFLNVVSYLISLPPPSPDVAYIHSSDTASAASYKSLVDSSGHLTALIPLSSVATTDFSSYKLIIIGSDTGMEATWGDSASVAAVNGSGKPIIGLGEGGYAFFGKLSLGTGWPNGWHGSMNSIYVVNSSHAVFHTPNPITVPSGNVIQLYTATGNVGIHLPSIPANIVALGREADDAVHYPLTLEVQRYLLWGFDASPAGMTQTGKDLFLNVVSYLVL